MCEVRREELGDGSWALVTVGNLVVGGRERVFSFNG